MSKKSIIIMLGILVALMPFLGFSGSVEEKFFIFAGLAVVVVEYFS